MNGIDTTALQQAVDRYCQSASGGKGTFEIHDAHEPDTLVDWLFRAEADSPAYHLFVTGEPEPHAWRVAEKLPTGGFVAGLFESIRAGELVSLGGLQGVVRQATTRLPLSPRAEVIAGLAKAREVVRKALELAWSQRIADPLKKKDLLEAVKKIAAGQVEAGESLAWLGSTNNEGLRQLLLQMCAAYAVGRRHGADLATGLPWLGDGHRLVREIARAAWTDLANGSSTTGAAFVALRLLWLLQDVASCLLAGAPSWVSGSEHVRVLLIDDNPERISEPLKCALGFLGDEGQHWRLDVASDRYWKKVARHLEGRDNPDEIATVEITSDLHGHLHDFDVILADVEYEGRALGPDVVGAISGCLDRRLRRDGEDPSTKKPCDAPRIVALSLSRDTRHIQQCLNQGAEAYVLKDRVYSLPAVLARGRRRQSWRSRGSRGNFRTLFQLPPVVQADLQDEDPHSKIIRGEEADAPWVRSLPKADLHCHIGTSIDPHVIQALAFNTCWYLLQGKSAGGFVDQLRDKIWHVVRDAAESLARDKSRSAATALWTAVTGGGSPPGNNVYDGIVRCLWRADRSVNEFEVACVLVAVLAIASGEQVEIARSLTSVLGAKGSGCQGGEGLVKDLLSTWERATRDRSWHCPQTAEHVRELANSLLKNRTADTLDRKLASRFAEVTKWLAPLDGNPLEPRQASPFRLRDLVKLPERPDAHERNLLRYLWGADLLGSAFLQYPENILLAAASLVEQARADNVTYTELRCATPGYTRGGLGSGHATDLLCQALDVCAHYHGCEGPDSPEGARWVRFNVLLGAKRHKPDREFDETVHLTAHYLQRGPTEMPRPCPKRPLWWQRCRVAGFDLSGDEKHPAENFRDRIEPLFALSAPITIHAGEAASAESVWQAVYRLGARRIGHGLRLREQARLIEYCASRGICLELCPISNEFTNEFTLPAQRNKYIGSSRTAYPLRFFMSKGLEVCIATDNRHLHVGSTLTDDYLMAARLSGGLTRWEVLSLVRAGFKNAFLPRTEIEELLTEVGDAVFKIARQEDFSKGRFWF